MSHWWRQLSERERMLTLGAALLLCAALGYALVLEPLTARLSRAEARLAETRALSVWLHQATRQIREPADVSRPARAGIVPDAFLGHLDASLQAAALREAVTALAPVDTGVVQLQFATVDYARLMTWLVTLSLDAGIEARTVEIRRDTRPGMVRATLRLSLPARR